MLEESAKEKDAMLQRKLKTVGNYVHDSVPISDNEVRRPSSYLRISLQILQGQQCFDSNMGTGRSQS